jgi:hypothetical protein
MRKFTKLMAALALLLFMTPAMVGWGQTTVDVSLSSGTYSNSVITWTCADGNITIQHLKGSGSTVPNSSYISAPRVYKQNILSFVGTNGYTITNIAIKYDGSYYGTTKYAGTEISNNDVNNNTTALTPTWSTQAAGTHTIATVSNDGLSAIYIQNGHSSDNNSQLRITKLTITYKVSGSVTATTVTINADGLTNTDIYTSTVAGSLSATVTETVSGNAISGATVTWSSSNTDVATIDGNGAVTLVSTGTTTITASYAGESGVYGSSSATYELTVTSSEPYVQPTTIEITPNYTFWGMTGQFSGSTYSELSGEQDNVTLDWTRGSGSTYANSTAMRFYKDNTLVFTAPTGYEIISIVITFASGYAPDDIAFSPTGYSLSGTTGTWTGSSATVTMSRPSNASSYAQITKFIITIGLPTSVADPTFNPVSGTTFGDEGLSVTISQADNEDIYYTLDSTEPTTSSTLYSEAIALTATTTIKAIASDGTNTSNVVTATYTYVDPNAPGTVNNPYTVAQAIANTPSSGNVYIQGIVSSFYNTSIVGDGSNYRYYISDDGTTTTQLLVYKGKGLNQATFTNANDLLVGDEVVICGSLITYQNAPEIASGNYLYSWNRPAADVEAPTFSPVAGTYTEAQTVTISCATANSTIYYTLDGTEPTNASTQYTSALAISSTTTVKAIAYVGTVASTVATATYHFCSADNPYTVTEALAFNEYPANGIYVHGIVSTAPTQTPTNNGELTYYISVDGNATNELEVYKGLDLEQAAFTAQDDIQVGDIVTVYGNVVIYNTTKEFAQGNYLVSFERPAQEYTLAVTCSANVEIFTFVDPNEQGVEGATTQQVISGTEVGISVSVPEGYILTLVVDGTDVTSQLDETGYYTFNMPTHNVTVTATASAAPVVTTNTYTLATSIESGKQYIIVGQADGDYYAMGEDKGNNRNAYGITLNGTTATATVAVGYYVHEFTISSLATDGFYSICDAIEPGYLYAASSSSNNLKTEATLDENHNGDWAISFNSDGSASVVASNSSYTRNIMRFNNSNILFSCYSTGQHPVYLYVKDETPVSETFTKTIAGWDNEDYDNPDASGWYLIASPIGQVDPDDVANMIAEPAANYDLFIFDQTKESEWQNYKAHTEDFVLEPGKGYLYANKNTVDLEFTGTAYTGTSTFPLVYNTSNPDSFMHGWNLVGNPFAEEATVSRPYYTLDDETFEYAAVQAGQSIEAMEGIFVHVTEAEYNANHNQTVTFTLASKHQGGSKGSSLTLNLTKSGKFVDRAIVGFGQGGTLPKFQFDRNHTKVYIPQDGQDYAIVNSEEMGAMPVNFKAENDGTYSLSFSSENAEFAYLHLVDNMTGKDIDLLQTPSYSFEAKTTDYESRFKLVFATGDNSKEDNFAFFSNGSFVINNEGNATLQVIDVTGRILKSANINGCTNVNVNAAPGVYMLRLVNGENVKVQKVVVE